MATNFHPTALLVCSKYDADGSGSIDAAELKDALDATDMEVSAEEVLELLETYDSSKRGEVNFDDFCRMQGIPLPGDEERKKHSEDAHTKHQDGTAPVHDGHGLAGVDGGRTASGDLRQHHEQPEEKPHATAKGHSAVTLPAAKRAGAGGAGKGGTVVRWLLRALVVELRVVELRYGGC